MIKIAAHVQDGSDWSRNHLRQALYPAVKCMGSCTARWFLEDILPAYFDAGKDRPFLWWRSWTDDQRDNYVFRGAAGARDFVDRVLPELDPWRQLLDVRITESINEFIPLTSDDMRRLNAFEAEACELFAAHGVGLIIGNFSVGWPDYPMWTYYRDALQRGEYLGKHEYGWPQETATGEDLRYYEHHVLRYRHDIRKFQALGYIHPPVILTEIGWDGALVGAGHRGFRLQRDQMAYLNWLQWYNSQIAADPQVLYANVFQTGAAQDWRDFDLIGSEPEPQAITWIRTGSWENDGGGSPLIEEARKFKLRINRAAALSQAIEAAGQWVGSDEFWHTGDSAHQWGVDYRKGIWTLWRWDRGQPCRVVLEEPVR